MKIIPLTQGFETIVDDEDYDFLMQWKWHVCKSHSNYAMRNSTYKRGKKRHHIMMHRVIMKTRKGMETDHENGNGLDNRRANLKNVTKSINQQTRHANKKSTSIYKGVCWHKLTKKWSASIQIDNKKRHLGLFDSPIEAATAYVLNAKKLVKHFNENKYYGHLTNNCTEK
jgi:hypothetical protein